MFARLILFTIGPGPREDAEELADRFAPAIKEMKGFKSTTFIADFDAGEYGTFSVWETREDAEAAGEALRPMLMDAIGDKLKGPPTVRLLEIYEP